MIVHSPFLPDDRRSLTLRLTVLQYVVARRVSPRWRSASGSSRSRSTRSSREMAENNHLRRLPLPAPRGVLFDRDGKVLVENRNTFNIALVREQTQATSTRRSACWRRATGADEAQLRETVNRRRREPSYRPIVLIENATLEQVIAVAARRVELPGIISQEVPARQYPASDMAAHLFGYVGEITRGAAAARRVRGRRAGLDGRAGGRRAGLQQAADGQRRQQTVVVNSVGREIAMLGEAERRPKGRRLQLTIDADVQRATEDGIRRLRVQRRRGRPRSAQRRSARVHEPSRLRSERLRRRHRPRDVERRSIPTSCKPLQNRALQGTLFAGLDVQDGGRPGRARGGRHHAGLHGVTARGGATFYGRYFECWKKGGHGSVDLRHAIEQSCDVYFYTVGNMLGVDRINKWATLLGLGVEVGHRPAERAQGLVPSTAVEGDDTKEKKWYAGETISVAIGQGQVSVTPISMAVYTATLANGGTRVTPHLVKAVDDGNGLKPVPPPPPQSKVDVTPEKLQAMRDGHVGGRQRRRAPAAARGSTGNDVCGKTGTAQVISNQGRIAAAKSDEGPARPRLVRRSSRRATSPRSPASCSSSTASTAPNAASVAHHILDDVLREEGRQAAAAAADARGPAPRLQGPVRARRGAGRRAGTSRHVRTPTVLPRRLAAARRDSAARRRSASR